MNHHAKRFTGITIAVVLLIGVSVGISAQQGNQGMPGQGGDVPEVDPNSEEFERFVEAYSGVQEIQQEVSGEVQELISDSPLSQQRFQQIHQQVQGPGSGEADIPEEERNNYESLLSDVQEVQQSSQEEMIAEVEDAELSVERFNQIATAIQNDQELQQRLQEMQQQSQS